MIIIFQNDHNQNFSRVDTLPELKKPTRHRQPLSIFTHCQIFIATHTWPHDLTCTSFSHAPRFLSPSSSHPHPYAPPPYHTRTTTQTSKIRSPFQCRWWSNARFETDRFKTKTLACEEHDLRPCKGVVTHSLTARHSMKRVFENKSLEWNLSVVGKWEHMRKSSRKILRRLREERDHRTEKLSWCSWRSGLHFR